LLFFMPIQSIFGFFLWLPNPMFLLSFTNFKLKLSDNFFLKKSIYSNRLGDGYQKLNTYFKTIGIHHRLIYPHTHEQNGMVECLLLKLVSPFLVNVKLL
jgi:hypothetical protein